MSKIKLLLLAIDLILIHTVDSSNVHYITPSPDTQCPAGESCLTLPTLAANSRQYFHSNTTVVFLEGSHTLDSELIASNINGPLMLLTNGSGTASIRCSGRLEFFRSLGYISVDWSSLIAASRLSLWISSVWRIPDFLAEKAIQHSI